MSGKPKGGSRKKSSTKKYHKRRKKERENRAIKVQKRMMTEFEFAQRIREEPSLKEVIEVEQGARW
ncbi:hypothetical protein ES703_60068 [subsurface metagenome]